MIVKAGKGLWQDKASYMSFKISLYCCFQDATMLIDASNNHPLFHHKFYYSAKFLVCKENLKVAMVGVSSNRDKTATDNA
jgi:hypothetical protein